MTDLDEPEVDPGLCLNVKGAEAPDLDPDLHHLILTDIGHHYDVGSVIDDPDHQSQMVGKEGHVEDQGHEVDRGQGLMLDVSDQGHEGDRGQGLILDI